MRKSLRVDPIEYGRQWAKQLPIDLPHMDESDHVIRSVSHHASLLYDNPLTEQLKPRDRYRLVRRQLNSYRGLIENLGIIPTLKKLKDLSFVFIRCFFVSPDNQLVFKLDPELLFSPLFWAMKTLSGVAVTEEHMPLIRYLLSWHVFLSKLPLSRPDLVDSAKTAWIERQVVPKPVNVARDHLLALRYIVGWLFELYPEFIGSHGPGYTSDGVRVVPEKNRKYRRSFQTDSLSRFLPTGLKVGQVRAHKRPSKWTAVAKDIGAVRPITQMPTEEQFVQQGLKFDFYAQNDFVRELPLSRFVRFSDQEPSRRCALDGSNFLKKLKSSTIDCSFASDRLSLELISEILSGDMLHYALAARTWDCMVDNKKVEIAMYDGMGSALTFPIQTLVFTACAIWATIMHLTRDEPYLSWQDSIFTVLGPDRFRKQFSEYERLIRVYGDDIALPDCAADILIELLEDLGLEVNVSKSFVGDSPFRESCGMYALGGHDVTPLRYKVPVLAEAALGDAAYFESLRGYINLAFDYGYRKLYRSLVKELSLRELFISSDELKKVGKPRKASGYPKRVDNTIVFGKPQLLFVEGFIGVPTIGIKSDRETSPAAFNGRWESVSCVTTYRPRSSTEVDDQSDFYHLSQWYRKRGTYVRDESEELFFEDFLAKLERGSSQSHGRIPRGTRLVLANARAVRSPANRDYTSSWVWAPS